MANTPHTKVNSQERHLCTFNSRHNHKILINSQNTQQLDKHYALIIINTEQAHRCVLMDTYLEPTQISLTSEQYEILKNPRLQLDTHTRRRRIILLVTNIEPTSKCSETFRNPLQVRSQSCITADMLTLHFLFESYTQSIYITQSFNIIIN